MRILLWVGLVIFSLCMIGWIGFSVKPAAFDLPELASYFPAETVEIPAGLPEPVERYYKTAFPAGVPDTRSAIFSGRGKVKPFGLWMPARFVFIHEAGQHYRHYIEATFFGFPLMKVEEGYVDGVSFFDAPVGHHANDPHTNQAANLALWAEAGWFPSVWLSDPRVSWSEIDENTAMLEVPFESGRESFVVRFSKESGLVDTMEAMRYRDPGEKSEKILWTTRNEAPVEGPKGALYPKGSATWKDQGSPWAYFTLEQSIFNADVSELLRSRGPALATAKR